MAFDLSYFKNMLGSSYKIFTDKQYIKDLCKANELRGEGVR